MRVLKYIVIAFIVSILVVSGANLLTSEEQSLGAITTILGTDRLTDSRTTINDNFTDLDTTKMEMATSSIDSITTLSNLTAVGALSSGSLTTGFTAIPVSLGGTGTTTPETYRVMLGDGSNGLTMASTSGTNGQFLTSSGDGSYPTWSTSAIDEGANYSWSGIHSFASNSLSAVGNFLLGDGTATTTINLNPAGNTASSTVMKGDGTGNYYHTQIGQLLFVGATSTSASAASTTMMSVTIPANTLGNNRAVIKGEANVFLNTLNDVDDDLWISLNFGDLGVASFFVDDITDNNAFPSYGTLKFYMNWDGTNQTGGFSLTTSKSSGTYGTEGNFIAGGKPESRSVSVASDQVFDITMKRAGASGTVTLDNGYIELTR